MRIYELKPFKYINQKSFYGKAIVVIIDSIETLTSYNLSILEYDNIKDTFKSLVDDSYLSYTTMKHLREYLAQKNLQCISKLPKHKLIHLLRIGINANYTTDEFHRIYK